MCRLSSSLCLIGWAQPSRGGTGVLGCQIWWSQGRVTGLRSPERGLAQNKKKNLLCSEATAPWGGRISLRCCLKRTIRWFSSTVKTLSQPSNQELKFLKIIKLYLNMSDNLEESSLCYLWPSESSISDLPKNKASTRSFANLPFIPPCPSVLLSIVPLVSFICGVQTLSHSANLFTFPEFSALLSHSLLCLAWAVGWNRKLWEPSRSPAKELLLPPLPAK